MQRRVLQVVAIETESHIVETISEVIESDFSIGSGMDNLLLSAC